MCGGGLLDVDNLLLDLDSGLDGLGAGHGAVGHEVEHLVRVLLDDGRALERRRRRVHDGHGLGDNRLNNVLDKLPVLLQQQLRLGLDGVPLGDGLDELEEVLGAAVGGEGQGEVAGGREVQLDVPDPGRPAVDALVGQAAQVEVEAGAVQRVDLGDGLGKGLAQLEGVGGALVDAEAGAVSLCRAILILQYCNTATGRPT